MYCPSVFMFWLIYIALFGGKLIHVMLQRNYREWTFQWCLNVFIFNILSKFLRDAFFCLFLRISLCNSSFLQQLWTFTENGLFSPKEGSSSFYVLYYYLCVGQWNFSLWKRRSVRGCWGLFKNFFFFLHVSRKVFFDVLTSIDTYFEARQVELDLLILKFAWLILM